MSNINFGQFNNNFQNPFIGLNANGVQNPELNPSQGQIQQQSTPLEVLLPNYISQLSQTAAELAKLNQQQTTNMIKDLMNFPKQFEQMVTQLTTNGNLSSEQTALLLLASNMNLTELSSLLKNSSKEAMSNLYKMVAQYNQIGASIKSEELSQLSKIISIVAASSTSDVQSLKTTMLMYLPWLPLTNPEIFKMEIEKSNSGGIESDSDSVSVFIRTENYGNVQTNIYKTGEDGIKIEMVTSETFPQNDFIVRMKEESKKYSININFDLNRKEEFNKDKIEKEVQTKVYMNTSPGVNPFLLLISNAVIKHVHIIDDKEKLTEQRKEKMEDGEN